MTTHNFHRMASFAAGGVMEPDHKAWVPAEFEPSAPKATSEDVSRYLAKLRAVIVATHGCRAVHETSAPITSSMFFRKAWIVTVEVFTLAGHPSAKRCYAWGARKPDGDWEVTTVLASAPIASPKAAVLSTR